MRKYKYEITLFVMNAVAMSLELVASRILAPYFGNSYIVWTCIIGIILFSNSIGNYFGGKLSDRPAAKGRENAILKYLILSIAISIFYVLLIYESLFEAIRLITQNVRVGSILSTILAFLVPNVLIGMISPLILKIKLLDNTETDKTGKIGGNVYAIGTIGSIVGTFASGFFLVPMFGSRNIIFILIIVCILNSILLIELKNKKELIIYIACIVFILALLGLYIYNDNNISRKILAGEVGPELDLDTQYGSVKIINSDNPNFEHRIRLLAIEGGAESFCYYDEEYKYDLVKGYYPDFYNQCLYANKDSIKNMLLIGGAGYTFPKYVISHYPEKYVDVVEIDEKITEVAKKYFFLNDLFDDYDLNENHRLEIHHNDGRLYMENNKDEKYDLVLNDAFVGKNPAKTLTTLECIKSLKTNLNDNGYYFLNIISSFEGEDSGFIKAEMKTMSQVFKNVYCLDFHNRESYEEVNNTLVIGTDGTFNVPEGCEVYEIKYDDSIILTDDYCPIESLYAVE